MLEATPPGDFSGTTTKRQANPPDRLREKLSAWMSDSTRGDDLPVAPMSDEELLARYTATGSQTTFAEIVERHLDFVYSVARRIVRSPDLAEDVAQAVFIQLARQARAPDRTTPLLGWLHTVTRRRAIDLVRQETRRRAREQAAVAREEMNRPDNAWHAIGPLLDDAINTLPSADQHIVLLRFFSNRSLREVGTTLGISEDTAQKRVSRAVDRLRAHFAKRGIAITTIGLASELAAHAVEVAPAGLHAAIAAATTAAGAGGGTSFLVMITAKKTALTLAIALAIGVGAGEARMIWRQKEELLALSLQRETLREQGRTERANYERTARVAPVAVAPDAAPLSPADQATTAAMRAWLERVDGVKRAFATRPELSTPELALLDNATWFLMAQEINLDSESHVRDALAHFRQHAENLLANRISNALAAYANAHDGVLPTAAHELAGFMNPPVEPDMLRRYEMIRSGKLSDLSRRDRMEVIVQRSPVDPDRDIVWHIGLNGTRSESVASAAVREAQKAYAADHGGVKPATATDLKTYLKWPVSEARVQAILDASGRPQS